MHGMITFAIPANVKDVARGFPAIILPAELIEEILQYALEGYAPNPLMTPWVRQIATVAKAWVVPVQRSLFRCIHLVQYSAGIEARRLGFFDEHPQLAGYVTVLIVSRAQQETLARLNALPRVQRLELRMEHCSISRGQFVALMGTFPHLLHLAVHNHRQSLSALHKPLDLHLSSFEFSGTLTQIIDDIAASPSRETLRAARIHFLNADQHLGWSTSSLSSFVNLHTLDLTVGGAVYGPIRELAPGEGVLTPDIPF
jgi:hypothetical protein